MADPTAPTALAEARCGVPTEMVERAMVRLRRSMSGRHLGQRTLASTATLGVEVSMQDLLVIDAIEEGPVEPNQGVTVGVVADRGALDPSRASRVVANAVQAGLVRRVADQADARRIHLELTDRGRRVADAAHDVRRAAFSEMMQDWSTQDQQTFALLLTRFTQPER